MAEMNQEHMNVLLDVALSMACDMLETKGKFFPYAVTLENDGNVQRSSEIDVDTCEDSPQDLYHDMQLRLKREVMEGVYTGVAVGLDCKVERFVSEGYVEAVSVYICHTSGHEFECYIPYKVNEDKTLTLGQVFAQQITE